MKYKEVRGYTSNGYHTFPLKVHAIVKFKHSYDVADATRSRLTARQSEEFSHPSNQMEGCREDTQRYVDEFVSKMFVSDDIGAYERAEDEVGIVIPETSEWYHRVKDLQFASKEWDAMWYAFNEKFTGVANRYPWNGIVD